MFDRPDPRAQLSYGPAPPWQPALGCFGTMLVFMFLCLMPFVLVDAMRDAMERLHLSPPLAVACVMGILLGSLMNVPVYRIEREEQQPLEFLGVFGFWSWTPRFRRVRRDTIVAVNVGGCVIPLLIALRQILEVLLVAGWPLVALLLVVAGNVAMCYRVARPVNGIGIMMPGFASPLMSVGLTWLLLLNSPEYAGLRAPVAFVAGVLGPVIGADLLHLRDLTKVSVGMLSIGGAGTFDGIVLSGVLAALLA